MKKALIYSINIPIITNVVIPSLKNISYNTEFINSGNDANVENYDVIVTLGWNEHIKKICTNAVNAHKKILCISDGYIKSNREFANNGRRNHGKGYFAITRNCLNAYGYHKYETNLPSDRWKKLGVTLAPYKKIGKYILIAHQNGLNLFGECRHTKFVKLVNQCKTLNKNIILTKHPNYGPSGHRFKESTQELSQLSKMGCTIKSSNKKLINDCIFVATCDSNTAVDSILLGKPVYTVDKTMVDMINNKSIKDIKYHDRTPWCNWIAYQQWMESEILSGEAYRYFKI